MAGKGAANLAPRITNRRALHDYFIEAKLECGIVLVGSEVKSLRNGKAQLHESFARVEKGGRLILYKAHIDPYDKAAIVYNHEPKRDRRLLLHKKQIVKLGEKVKEKGYTLLPLEIYLNQKGRVKVLLGLCKGKQQHDKRQAARERDARREMARATGRGGSGRR